MNYLSKGLNLSSLKKLKNLSLHIVLLIISFFLFQPQSFSQENGYGLSDEHGEKISLSKCQGAVILQITYDFPDDLEDNPLESENPHMGLDLDFDDKALSIDEIIRPQFYTDLVLFKSDFNVHFYHLKLYSPPDFPA